MYEPDHKTLQQLHSAFTYHPPTATQVPRYVLIRAEAEDFARMLARNCPPSRELSLALTNLEQAVMWANAAIARNEGEKGPVTTDY